MLSCDIVLYECPNFSHNESNYQTAKKHSALKPDVTSRCTFYQEFLGLYALGQHKNTQHSIILKSTKYNPDNILNKVDDTKLKPDLRSCQNLLVDFELEQENHKVFDYAMENLKQQ